MTIVCALPRVLAALLLSLAAAVAGASPAATPTRALDLDDLGAPWFTTFSVRDGLPASVMAGIAVDREGFVWAASAEGLARYDGKQWETRRSFTPDGVLGAFTLDHAGSLWVAFRDRGVARLDGEQWRFEDALPSHQPTRMIELADTQGQLTQWVLSNDAGLLQRVAGRWLPAARASQLPSVVLGLAATTGLGGDARIWAGTGAHGLWYRTGNSDWQQLAVPALTNLEINDLLVTHADGHEQLWIATFGGGLWRLDHTGLRSWRTSQGALGSDMYYRLAQSRDDEGGYVLWAASRAGLVRIHHDQMRVFDRRYGLPSDVVRDLVVWRSPGGAQVLWLATESGIARTVLGASPWQTVSLAGASATGVFATRVEDDGRGGERLWVGAIGEELALFDQSRWQRVDPPAVAPLTSVRLIKRAADSDDADALWIGFQNGQLAHGPGPERLEVLDTPWPHVPQQAVLDVLERTVAGSHELWVATRMSGLYRHRDGRWQDMRPQASGGHWAARGLVEQRTQDGRSWIWASGQRGLYRHDGEQGVLLGTEIGLPGSDLDGISLIEDAGRPVLWIGSSNGIVRVDVADPMRPRVLAGDLPAPPDPFVYNALRDSRGRIYLCTNNGVQQLIPRGAGYDSRVFTRRDGMPHEECNLNAQFIDAHDRLWVGTLGGLGVYDPAREQHDREAKPLRLTRVDIDDQPAALDQVVLRPGDRDLTVHFALLSWHNEDESQFRSQLLGDETEPTPWTGQNTRTLSRLPPGRYTLRVEARDYAGNASTPLELAISVLPDWWQTLPARLATVLVLTLLAYLLLHWRTRALQARQRELRQLVAARTAELDAANARLTEMSYHDALTGLANRHKLREAFDAALHARAHRPWSLIFLDVDHFKDYNDRHGHPAGDEALRAVAAAMHACAPSHALLARYGGEEFACLLPDTSIEHAHDIAERIRIDLAARSVAVPGESTVNHVTISAGVAERVIATPADAHRLLRDADQALYRAKHAGRNCVMR